MKRKDIFDPEYQHQSISGKVVIGLERISEVFKTLLWDKAKVLGISPIQIQLLVFIHNHKESLCNVSHLAKEFNITKPTVSDAVRALHKKGYLIKNYSSSDNRSYSIQLSQSGKQLVEEAADFITPLQDQIENLDKKQLEALFETLSTLIYKLNRSGILQVQRTCYGCKFYQKEKQGHYCNLMEKPLSTSEIRLDCPEFEKS